MDELVPADVRDFIFRYIDSVAQLEALLLLRANPGRGWTVAAVAERLYISAAQAGEVLARLCEDGLLAASDAECFRYDGPAEARALVDTLVDVYGRHLIQVTNLIHSKPRRVRAFAEAFKFRKDR